MNAVDKNIGTCGLCRTPNSKLQRSHMYPAAAYKRMRNPAANNAHPVLVTPKVALQISSQTQDYFLCWNCEQLLRANGEDWMMRNCWQSDGTFPLQRALQHSVPDAASPVTMMYAASKIKEIDIKKLAYFAVS